MSQNRVSESSNKPSREQVQSVIEETKKTMIKKPWQKERFQIVCNELLKQYNSTDLVVDKEGIIYIKIGYQIANNTVKKRENPEIVPLMKWLENKDYHIGKSRFRTAVPFTSLEIRDILSKPTTPLQE